MVEGDEVRLREALTNLITNAIKYSPNGKTIDVEVFSANGECAVAVRDEGPGLSAEEQKQLFQPFQRLTPRPTNGEPSSGLGLYIVRQLMTLHAGRVTAESERGLGSTFTLLLPSITKPLPVTPLLSGSEPAARQI
jgi:signal transduction histidine kinase